MYWLVWVLSGLVSWGVMSYFMKDRAVKGGWWASLLSALVGAWLGDWVMSYTSMPDWSWMLSNFNVIAGLVGGGLINWLWGLVK